MSRKSLLFERTVMQMTQTRETVGKTKAARRQQPPNADRAGRTFAATARRDSFAPSPDKEAKRLCRYDSRRKRTWIPVSPHQEHAP